MPSYMSNNKDDKNHVFQLLGDGSVLVDVRGSLCPVPVIETKVAIDAYPKARVITIVDNEVSRDNVVKFGQSRKRHVEVMTEGDDFYITFKELHPDDDAASPFGSAAMATHLQAVVPKESIAIAPGNLTRKSVDMRLSGADTGLIDDPTTSAVSGPVEGAKGRLIIGPNTKDSSGLPATLQWASKTLLVTKNYLGEGSEELGQTLMKTFWYCVAEADVKPSKVYFINSGVKMVAQDSPHLENLKALADAGVEIAACGICLDFYGLKEQVAVGSITNLYAITDAMMTEPMVTL